MSVPEPSKILTPWATSGLKNQIPQAANPVTGNAGYDQGFPAINMTAKEAGGIPPFGQDFNGILNDITSALQFFQAGGVPVYDQSFALAVGGYATGAMVLGSDGLTQYQNQVNGNTSNPNTGGAGWLSVVPSQFPVGAPIPWPATVPPAGFIAMIGQSFSATTYPRLAQAYPSLVLPDMRAEFIRGWDAGRGVDAGRTILSPQGDAIRNITGSFIITDNNSQVGGIGGGAIGAFAASNDLGKIPNWASGSVPGTRFSTATFSASNVVPTATENRTRNIAFNYIVRAA